MKSLLQLLGIQSESEKRDVSREDSTLAREIRQKLGRLPPERLRFLAAFGGLLGCVANRDGVISDEEETRIREVLKTVSLLSAAEADIVARIVHEQTKALVGLENHMYAREINELADPEDKIEVVSSLFAIAAADDEISPEENEELRRITKALLLTHRDFIIIRSRYRDKLSVLKNLPGWGGG